MSRPRILVVDDDPRLVAIIRAGLLCEGRFDVETATDGAMAIASVEASPPEVILLDLGIAGIDGFDVLANLRGRPETRTLPVIILSGLGSVVDRVRGLDAGGDDYLVKPVDLVELVARIRVQLRVKRLRDEVEGARRALARRDHGREVLLLGQRRLTRRIVADLRAPLAQFDANLAALRAEFEVRDDPAAADRLHRLEGAAVTFALLASELLTTSHLDPVRIEPELVTFAPRGVLATAIREATREAARAGVRVESTSLGELPTVDSDPTVLRRLVRAVVMHAVGFTADGGTVQVSAEFAADGLRLGVEADSICGLPAELLSATLVAERRRGASGVQADDDGIAYARSAVDALGGQLTVAPRPDRPGARYQIALPCRSPALVA